MLRKLEVILMLKRKVYRELLQWKEQRHTEHIKKCLLLKGARQVGKSFIKIGRAHV